jgi:hypothetical protein
MTGIIGTIALVSVALAAICVIIGAKETGARIMEGAGKAVTLLALAYCLVSALAQLSVRIGRGGHRLPASAIGAALALAAIGFVAWKTRAHRDRRKETARRRDMHARRRLPPPPPPPSAPTEGGEES